MDRRGRPGRQAFLVWRAVLAIALMIAFYVLALATAAVLIAFPVLLLRVNVWFAVKVGIFTVVGAFIILGSIVPRRDRFEPPGPLLSAAAQPRLFSEIRRVAAATRQAEPAEVYLVADVNAWVGQRGGLMGIGSRRVIGLGLPLLQALTVPELRAVLAHEFGHFDGGDVALGPWIHSTRSALLRTLEELHGHSAVIAAPFSLFAHLFFRCTHAVTRQQEIAADQLAARVGGARHLASGLRATDRAAFAFGPYWYRLVDPLLSAGLLPPLAAGFDAFLRAPWLPEAHAASRAEAVTPGPFDTHPPLHARLAALGVGPGADESPAPPDGPPALSLLDDVPALESRLAAILTRREPTPSPARAATLALERPLPALTPVAWHEVGARAWLPDWERIARESRRHLSGLTPDGLAQLDWHRLGRRLVAGSDEGEPLVAADTVVGAAVAVLLVRAGCSIHSAPGESARLDGFGERIEPFGLRERLAGGPEAAAGWRELCARAGIADADMGAIERTSAR